jgi:hypothetical protein
MNADSYRNSIQAKMQDSPWNLTSLQGPNTPVILHSALSSRVEWIFCMKFVTVVGHTPHCGDEKIREFCFSYTRNMKS